MVTDNDTLSAKLIEINSSLVKELVEHVVSVLGQVSTAIEEQGAVDKAVLDKLASLTETMATVVSRSNELMPKTKEALTNLEVFFKEQPFNDDSRTQVLALLRQVSNAASSWSIEEKKQLVSIIESGPSCIIKAKKQVQRVYWTLIVAGGLSILASVGAPEWIRKLLLIVVGHQG